VRRGGSRRPSQRRRPSAKDASPTRRPGPSSPARYPTTSRPRSLVIDRYHVGWLLAGGRAFESDRLGGSGSFSPFPVRAADRRLAPATQSIALRHEQVALSLDPDGLHRLTPALTFGG